MKTADERRAIKDRMPQTRLEMRHTQNCTLLPDRGVMLELLPKDGVAAEIGVAFGAFSRQILTRNAPRTLHLIDAWSTERYGDGLAAVQRDLADEIAGGRVIVHQGLSTDVLAGFPPAMFDWVYIDTNHTYDTTKQELELCAPRIAPGGRIAGHDFCTGNVIGAVPYGVVEAVTAFCKDHGWQFEYLTVESRGHFSFCLTRL